METVENISLQKVEKFKNYRKLVFKLLRNFKKGYLIVTDAQGEQHFFGDNQGIHADIQIKNDQFYKKCVLYGDIGFGEAYVDGDWETSSIKNVIQWMIFNLEHSPVISGGGLGKTVMLNLLGPIQKWVHKLNANSKKGSQRNISYHYDLSNQFYQHWLDSSMTYSSALFDNQEESLESAQMNKYERICQMLQLKPGMKILEIGCGWGGFAEYAAKNYRVKVEGITISNKQLEFACHRINQAGLSDQVELAFKDYRDLKGQYDRIVSIEMVEAVGHEYLPVYIKNLSRLLAPNGLIVLQAITSPDSRYQQFKNGVDWIQKHIFPGSLLPSVGELSRLLAKETDLQIHDLKDFGLHYAKTLSLWYINFNQKEKEISALGFGENFKRKWHYYLKYCEAAFSTRNISVVQLTLSRPNNKSLQGDYDF